MELQFEHDRLIWNGKTIPRSNTLKGTSKRVYVIIPYIFKYESVSLFSECKAEIDMWFNKIEPQDKEYFADILEHGQYNESHWVKMLYYDFIDINDYGNKHLIPTQDEFDKVNRILEKYGIDDAEFSIYNGKYDIFNCGITVEGKIKIYDYGREY